MYDVFTTREVAIFIWFLIIAILISLNKNFRSGFINVLKCIFNKQILIPFLF